MSVLMLANFGMLFLLLGTLPSILSAIKSRNNLSGFNVFGALFIIIGQSLYSLYFVMLGDYITTLLSLPLIVYWVLVIIFSIKKGTGKK